MQTNIQEYAPYWLCLTKISFFHEHFILMNIQRSSLWAREQIFTMLIGPNKPPSMKLTSNPSWKPLRKKNSNLRELEPSREVFGYVLPGGPTNLHRMLQCNFTFCLLMNPYWLEGFLSWWFSLLAWFCVWLSHQMWMEMTKRTKFNVVFFFSPGLRACIAALVNKFGPILSKGGLFSPCPQVRSLWQRQPRRFVSPPISLTMIEATCGHQGFSSISAGDRWPRWMQWVHHQILHGWTWIKGRWYVCGFHSQLLNSKRLLEDAGAKLVLDKISLDYIKGATIDFVNEIQRQSFVVASNPNAKSHCGCNVSFSIDWALSHIYVNLNSCIKKKKRLNLQKPLCCDATGEEVHSGCSPDILCTPPGSHDLAFSAGGYDPWYQGRTCRGCC